MDQPLVYLRNIREDSVQSGAMLCRGCHDFFKERECGFQKEGRQPVCTVARRQH